MQTYDTFYIDGQWVHPADTQLADVINPADEHVFAQIAMGNADDVDRAVAAARRALDAFSESTVDERIALLERIVTVYDKRIDDMAQTISEEMGAPITLARKAQAPMGRLHFKTAIEVLHGFEFERMQGPILIRREPIGVCGMITPWNWPANQIACKVAPALAAGCTMVLKPSEIAPLSAVLFAEIFDEAGVPPGVFNLVLGDGPAVGMPLSSHPDVDLMSFTGSTRAGISVAKCAADTVKRVAQELGGKSANVILASADLQRAVTAGVKACFNNSGQSCNAPTRMLVPAECHDEAVEIARAAAATLQPGDPRSGDTVLGPVVSAAQYNRVQGLIQKGMDEGATLVTGGKGRPAGIKSGYFVKPTIFANVNNDMAIAREEIFGPVLCIIPYADENDAVAIANDSRYGLSGYVQGAPDDARRIARRLKAGMIHLNGTPIDPMAPFGGYKQSGNGREWGPFGLEEYLEVKSVLGWDKGDN